jgi:hypothetical protein
MTAPSHRGEGPVPLDPEGIGALGWVALFVIFAVAVLLEAYF